MVEPRPTKLPVWNTGGSNRTEPLSAKKILGWVLSEAPPSSYFNWLQYYSGAWFTWISERLLKGVNETDLTVNALQPDTSGAGGTLKLEGGDANTSGAGGNVAITAGATVSGDGGDTVISGGAGSTTGGNVNLTGGGCTGTGPGGHLVLSGGTPTDGSGGDITISGGTGVGYEGGDVDITAGASDTNAGDITVTGGANTASGPGGNVTVEGGAAANGTAGYLILNGGVGNGVQGGNVSINGGDSDIAAGDVKINGGDNTSSGTGGAVELTAGEGIGAAGGAVNINAGESDTSAGNLSIEAGENNAAGNGGAATISGGTATVGTGGAAALIGGSVNSTGAGGNASTRGGDGSGTDQNGGYAYVQTGKSTGQGGSLVALQVSESEYSGSGSGSYVNAWSTYINANGNSGNKDVAINRHARFTDSADTTRGNIRLVAKSEPTGPSDGDVYNDSVTHQIGFYNGTRYHNLNPTVYNISDDAVTGQNPAALASTAYVLNEVPYGGVVGTTPLRHIIPANTLRVGSIIRVRAIMQLISLGGVSTFPTPKIYVGSIGAGPSPYTSPTGVQILAFSRASLAWDSCGVECELRVRSLGASGNVDLSWRATYDESSSVRPVHNQSIVNTSTLATNGALDVFAVALFGSSVGWQVDLTQFVVEIL